MSAWRSTARKGGKVTRSPKISFAAKARIASAPTNSRRSSLTKASEANVAIQASISWPLQAARWRATTGGRSLVTSLDMFVSRWRENYRFLGGAIRRSDRIVSIPEGNRSVVRFGEQLSQKVNKHGDFAGLTAGRGSHGADRNLGRLTIAQDSPHGSGAYVGRKKPVRRLGDTEAGKDRGAELFAIIAAKRCRRLIGYHPRAAGEGPGPRTIL